MPPPSPWPVRESHSGDQGPAACVAVAERRTIADRSSRVGRREDVRVVRRCESAGGREGWLLVLWSDRLDGFPLDRVGDRGPTRGTPPLQNVS